MIENYPIKTDSVSRLVIPKEIRNKYNINSTTRLNVVEKEDCLLLEKINYILTIDRYGRVLIPKNIRGKYSIFNNQVLLLSTTATGIKIKSPKNKYQKIIHKLKFLENNYNFKIILFNDKNDLIYSSKDYKKLEVFDSKDIDKFLTAEKVKYTIKKFEHISSDSLILYIIYDNSNKQLLDLIFTLL